MVKQIININQVCRYEEVDVNGRLITFEKGKGSFFSDSKEHQDIVKVLLSRKGFQLKEDNKKPKVDLEPEEDKKVSEKETKEDKTPTPKKKETYKKGE